MPAKSPTKKPARKKSSTPDDLYRGASFGAQEAIDLGRVLGHTPVHQVSHTAPSSLDVPHTVHAPSDIEMVSRQVDVPAPQYNESRGHEVVHSTSPAPSRMSEVSVGGHPGAQRMMWVAIACVMMALVGVWGASLHATWQQFNEASFGKTPAVSFRGVNASFENIQKQFKTLINTIPVQSAVSAPSEPLNPTESKSQLSDKDITSAMRTLLADPKSINELK